MTREVPVPDEDRDGWPLVFTPDNKGLVYQSDGRIMMADVATGANTHQWPVNLAPVTAMALSGDGQTLYTGHQDGSFNIFTFPGGEKIGGSRVHNMEVSRIRVGDSGLVNVDYGAARHRSVVPLGRQETRLDRQEAFGSTTTPPALSPRTPSSMPS